MEARPEQGRRNRQDRPERVPAAATEATAPEGAVAGKPARAEGQQRRPRPERTERAGAPPEAVAEGTAMPAAEFADTQPEHDATAAGAEGQAGAAHEGREGNRRRRRGGRGRRDREGMAVNGEGQAPAENPEAAATANAMAAEASEPVQASGSDAHERGDAGERPARDPADDGQRRRGRRGGQRAERGTSEAAPAAEGVAAEADVAATYIPPEPAVTAFVPPVEPVEAIQAAAPVAPTAAAAAVVPPPVVAAAPVQPPFELPVATLTGVAQQAGLEWVNSDAEKVRAAQEQMARAPQRVHVPREIKPAVKLDEGPLVLVETRKDLGQVKLPFEVGAEEPAQH